MLSVKPSGDRSCKDWPPHVWMAPTCKSFLREECWSLAIIMGWTAPHSQVTGVKRRYVLAFFEKLPPCLVGIEACASAHHWSGEFQPLGHTVRLMPPA